MKLPININPITQDYLVNIFQIAAIFANLVAEVDTHEVDTIQRRNCGITKTQVHVPDGDCLSLTLQSFMSSCQMSPWQIFAELLPFHCFILSPQKFILIQCTLLSITFMQQTLKCKVNISVWGHESHWENLWDFIITSVERKLTIIGSLRSDLIHWAESQAKPRGAGREQSEWVSCRIITRNRIMQQGASDWNCFLISAS